MRVSDYRPNVPIILGDLGIEPKILPKLTEAELIAMQPPSTQKLLSMDPSEPFIATEDWRAVPDAKTTDEAVGKRDIDPQEAAQYLADRRQRQHVYRADKTSLIGRVPDCSVSDEKRHMAINALRYTPPAQVTPDEVKAKAVGLVEYKSEPLVEVWVDMSWWQALIHRLKGNKIRQESK